MNEWFDRQKEQEQFEKVNSYNELPNLEMELLQTQYPYFIKVHNYSFI